MNYESREAGEITSTWLTIRYRQALQKKGRVGWRGGRPGGTSLGMAAGPEILRRHALG